MISDLKHTVQVFDSAAESYDEIVLSNQILLWMRKQVWKIYGSQFKAGDRILELNAGTGIDAIHLANQGMEVFATDASERMTDIINRKANSNGTAARIKVRAADFSHIGGIEESGFDGAISNFGGLNCIDDFEELSMQLSSKLKPGGKFIAVVMNKLCPWEIGYYMMKVQPKTAVRRFSRNGIDVRMNGHNIKTYYFTPSKFIKSFRQYFTPEKIYTLGLFTPPPYLYGIYKRMKSPVKILMKLDSTVKDIFPFNRMGDHFVSVMRRKS